MPADGPAKVGAPRPPDETLDQLYEHARVGYLTLAGDNAIVRLNLTLADWLGAPRESLLGQPLQSLLTAGARIFYETHCAPILRKEGVVSQVALDLRRADGSALPALVDWRRVDAEGRPVGFRVVVVEASERRAWEREILAERQKAREVAAALARLNAGLEARVEARTAELLELQKMESLGQLTSGVAHDFNNLLGPILACLDRLARLDLDPRDRRALEGALDAAERSRALTGRLLAFARRQPPATSLVEPADLVLGLRDLLSRSVGPGIALAVEAAPDLPRVRVDHGQLELAILNLCLNARDAMPAGGRLTVRADREAPGRPEGPRVAIGVADTGVGMDAETVRRATEPFFTTKPVGHGTGLGLAMAHKLMQESGGDLRIRSAPGQGTTIMLLLPAEGPEA